MVEASVRGKSGRGKKQLIDEDCGMRVKWNGAISQNSVTKRIFLVHGHLIRVRDVNAKLRTSCPRSVLKPGENPFDLLRVNLQ